jgi:hypothetical protein
MRARTRDEGEHKASPLQWTSHYPKVDMWERRGVDSGQKRQEERKRQESWAQQEVGQAHLGHKARTKRLVKLVED